MPNQDEYGRQKHIAWRGKHLRVSRTGGVSLRHQAKLSGLNLTVNSRHGLRVSTRVAKNTQVALQNGRLVLRGRYGRGPTKLNVSKSGLSVSTRNSFGTYNWTHPNRSSFKVGGVLFRGKKAAELQAIAMIFMLIPLTLVLVGKMLLLAINLLWYVGQLLMAAWQASIRLMRNLYNSTLKWRIQTVINAFDSPIDDWSLPELGAAIWLVYHHASLCQHLPNPSQETLDNAPLLRLCLPQVKRVAKQLPANIPPTLLMAALSEQLAQKFAADIRAELLLQVDEAFLAQNQKRTNLQERLINIYADFNHMRFEWVPEKSKLPAFNNENKEVTQRNVINLNTASQSELQQLPGIGAERAAAITNLRPINNVEQLKQVPGIGPARLRAIIKHGVTL